MANKIPDICSELYSGGLYDSYGEVLFYHDWFVVRKPMFSHDPSNEVKPPQIEDNEIARLNSFEAHEFHVGCFCMVK